MVYLFCLRYLSPVLIHESLARLSGVCVHLTTRRAHILLRVEQIFPCLRKFDRYCSSRSRRFVFLLHSSLELVHFV